MQHKKRKLRKKCYNLRLDKTLSGRLQGLCHAICKQVHGLPFARLCCVVLLVRCQFGCWRAVMHSKRPISIECLPMALQMCEWGTAIDL